MLDEWRKNEQVQHRGFYGSENKVCDAVMMETGHYTQIYV